MKILILTGRFGNGHYSAAQSLARRLKDSTPQAAVEIEDIFEYSMPDRAGCVYKAFRLMVEKGGALYNHYYKMTENKRPDFRPVGLRFFLKKLDILLRMKQPDVILSTLPLCSQIVSRYKEQYKLEIPLITCITDLSSHSEWINRETNVYLVGSSYIKERLIQKGVGPDKIIVNGIPVKPEFGKKSGKSPKKKKNLLIMGGGLGLLPESQDFYRRLNELEEISVTVIAGHNRKIYEMLKGAYKNIEVIGFTDEVYKYMRNADVVLSKPGGVTFFETMQSETPFLVFAPFLQQEINNSRFIADREIGRILDKKDDCVEEIQRFISNDIALYKMRKNIRSFKKEYNEHAVERILYYYAGKKKGIYA